MDRVSCQTRFLLVRLFAKQKTNEQSKQFFFRVIAVTWAILVRLFTSQKTNEQAPFVYFFYK